MTQQGERKGIISCLSRSRSELRRVEGKKAMLEEWMGFDLLSQQPSKELLVLLQPTQNKKRNKARKVRKK
jgi:hypothetical protein